MKLQQACIVVAAGVAGGITARCAVSQCRKRRKDVLIESDGEDETLRTAAAQTSTSSLTKPSAAQPTDSTTIIEQELNRLRSYIEDGASPRAYHDATCMRNCVRKLTEALSGQIPTSTTTPPPCESSTPCGTQIVVLLHSAVARDMVHIVSLLLAHGVPPDIAIRGKYPIHVACERKLVRSEMLETLLRYGASPNAEDAGNSDVTALHLSVTHGNLRNVELLLAHPETDRAKANAYGWQPAHLAAAMNRLDVLQLLNVAGSTQIDVTQRNNRGSLPLHLSCTAQAHAASKWLIAHAHSAVLAVDDDGNTPLHLALLSTDKRPALHEVVDLLLQHGATVTAKNARGRTPLHNSLSRGHGKLSAVLLVEGADPSFADDALVTPMHLAASCGDVGMLALLLGYRKDTSGAGLDLQDAKGRTPVHVASANGHLSCLELLVKHGADLNTVDDASVTPLLSALHNDRRDTAAALVRGGACGNVTDKDGNTALAISVYQGKEHSSLAEELIVKQKVRVNTADVEVCRQGGWVTGRGGGKGTKGTSNI